MLVFAAIIFVLILAAICLFVSPQISAVPYFPSNKKDLPLIIRGLNLRNNQTVVDLGAGDGVVIFEAAKRALAKKLNTKFIAVELNPILLLIMYIKRYPLPNKQNIKIVYADMFKANIKDQIANSKNTDQKSNILIYLYISPWFLEKLYKKLRKDFKNFELISYFYPVPGIKTIKKIKGTHQIFFYRF